MQLGSMNFHMRMGIASEILLFVLHKVPKRAESLDGSYADDKAFEQAWMKARADALAKAGM